MGLDPVVERRNCWRTVAWSQDGWLAVAERCFRVYALAGADPTTSQFVDGGVLDNKPFGWAIDAIRERYSLQVEVYRPQAAAVENYVQLHGRDAFYRSLELRQRCCGIRKVEPLARALAGRRAWITGQRREQASSRAELAEHEYDTVHGLEKFNPLATWSESEVWQYLREHGVPYNRLYDEGYRSIGCAPCTRPVLPTEDARSGRWWWEQPETKECGLHVAPDGRLVRTKVAA